MAGTPYILQTDIQVWHTTDKPSKIDWESGTAPDFLKKSSILVYQFVLLLIQSCSNAKTPSQIESKWFRSSFWKTKQ